MTKTKNGKTKNSTKKTSSPPRRRFRRTKKRGKHYFTQDHEDAIVQYCKTDCIKERTKLYVEYIQPAFDEMVDKIVYTYKFTNLPNIDDLRAECKVWLTTILDKYDPSKGSKAFSYFSVITKNWFIHKIKKNSRRVKREIQLSEITNVSDHPALVIEHGYDTEKENEEFWMFLWKEIDTWDTGNLKTNEKKVLEAVKILLANPDDIEIFNKKAIYLYLREITGLNTKQVVNNLNKLRAKYGTFKKKWNKGEL